jgi:delta1-piperideine-2-carboxylate reductase
MTVILSVDEARSLAERCLQTAGYSAADSAIIADHLIDCELRGVSSGGLPRLLSVLERLRDTPQPAGEIRLLHENAVSASFDGGDQVGYLVGHNAAMVAIAKAKETGAGIAGAKNTWMTGMFSYYMEMAAREGLAAMAAGSSVQAVAPFGGTEPHFGTNPIAFGFPSDDGPVIWDIGSAATKAARLRENRIEVPDLVYNTLREAADSPLPPPPHPLPPGGAPGSAGTADEPAALMTGRAACPRSC